MDRGDIQIAVCVEFAIFHFTDGVVAVVLGKRDCLDLLTGVDIEHLERCDLRGRTGNRENRDAVVNATALQSHTACAYQFA